MRGLEQIEERLAIGNVLKRMYLYNSHLVLCYWRRFLLYKAHAVLLC